MVDFNNLQERQSAFRRMAADYEFDVLPLHQVVYGTRAALVDQVILRDPMITQDIKEIFIKQKNNLFCLDEVTLEQAETDLKENTDPEKVLRAAARKFLEFINIRMPVIKDKVIALSDLQDIGPFFWQAVRLAKKQGSDAKVDPEELKFIARHLRDVGRILIDTKSLPS